MNSMEHIGSKLSVTPQTKGAARTAEDRKTERGEMMRYFCTELNRDRIRDALPPITMSRMGKILEGLPTKDLYYIKRVAKDASSFSKTFWWLLDPKKHTDEELKKRSSMTKAEREKFFKRKFVL